LRAPDLNQRLRLHHHRAADGTARLSRPYDGLGRVPAQEGAGASRGDFCLSRATAGRGRGQPTSTSPWFSTRPKVSNPAGVPNPRRAGTGGVPWVS